MTTVFLAPHNDDETLFGAFTLLREKPLVVVVYDCGREREAETNHAMQLLGCAVEHWRLPLDDQEPLAQLDGITDLMVYAPLPERDGQPQHNLIGEHALDLRGARLVQYLTYTAAGKSTQGKPVVFELDWIALKLQALACYPSQSGHPSHAPHFLRDQTEYHA